MGVYSFQSGYWLPSWTIVVSDTKVAVAEDMGPALPDPAVPREAGTRETGAQTHT